MAKYLAVEIEHSKYARFLSLEGRDRRSSNLTTLVDKQRRAEVKIFIVVDGKKELLHNFKVTSLPPQRAGEPRLLLSGNFDGNHTVRLALKINGKPYASQDLQVRRYLRRRRGGLIAGLLAAACVLVLLLWLLLRGCSAEKTLPSAEPSRETSSPKIASPETASPAAGDKTGPTDTGMGTDTDAPAKSSSGSTGSASEAASKSPASDRGSSSSDSAPVSSADSETDKRSVSVSDTVVSPAATTSQEEEAAQKTNASEGRQPPILESGTIYFEPDTSFLTPAAKEKLAKLAMELRPYEGPQVRIRGHCALYGTERGRIELSRQRAREAYSYLREAGWRPQSPPKITGMGGKEPVTTDEHRQYLNRRVEVLIR